MNRKKPIVCMVILVLIFAMIPSFISCAKTVEKNNGKIKFNTSKSGTFKPLIFQTKNFFALDELDGDILVSNETGNETKPSIAVDNNKVVVGFEYEFEENNSVIVKRSEDFGLTYSDNILIFQDAYSPSFTKIRFGGDFFGAFLTTEDSSFVYELDLPGAGNAVRFNYSGIENPEGEEIGDFLNFESLDVISYPDPTINFIIATIGDGVFTPGNEEYNCDDSPIFFYKEESNPANNRTIVFFPEVSDCNNISICLGEDSSEEPMVYGVCEQLNNSKNSLLFFHGNTDIWGDEDLLRKHTIEYSEDIYNPKIASYENNIYIVANTESNDIKLFYSSNYGQEGSFIVYNVTEDLISNNSKPTDPNIYAEEGKIMVSFINSSNLYKAESETNGSSWINLLKVNKNNDSVINSAKSSDIGNLNKIIWTDDRSENSTDLYTNLGEDPLIDINVTNIGLTKERPVLQTNNYLSITVKNNGNVPWNEDIFLNVTYMKNDGNSTEIDYPFLIDGLEAGEEKTIERRFFMFSNPEYFESMLDFAGIESMSVEIEPDSSPALDTNTANDKKTISVDYEDIFPVLGRSQLLETVLQMVAKILSFFDSE